MRDLVVTLLQVVIFFGSWGFPYLIGSYWARSASRRRPRPHPDDYRYNEKSRADRDRELSAIESAEYDAYFRSGEFIGVLLAVGCAALAYYLPVLIR